jgi:antirestriction protein ArdC
LRAFSTQQYQQVVEQVRGLAEQRGIVLHHGGKRSFHAFLADFLRDPAHTGLEQGCGVATSRTFAFALGDTHIQCRQNVMRRMREATGAAEMAGRAGRLGDHQ